MDGRDLNRFTAWSEVKVVKMSAFHMSWFIHKLRESVIFKILGNFVVPVGDVAEVEVSSYQSIHLVTYEFL